MPTPVNRELYRLAMRVNALRQHWPPDHPKLAAAIADHQRYTAELAADRLLAALTAAGVAALRPDQRQRLAELVTR